MSWDQMSRHKHVGGMGFRGLRDVNIDMIENQGWRLLSKPDFLVSKVFRARYYPRGDFLSTEVG